MNINSLITEVVQQPADIGGIMPQVDADSCIISCDGSSNLAAFSAIDQIAGTVKYDKLDIGQTTIDELNVHTINHLGGVATLDSVFANNTTTFDLYVTNKITLGHMGDIAYIDQYGQHQSLFQTLQTLQQSERSLHSYEARIGMLENQLLSIQSELVATRSQNTI